MSQHNFVKIARGSVTTPALSTTVAAFIDLDGQIKLKNSAGFIDSLITNASTASQSPTAATRTYITGSQIALAAAGALQIGTMFRWRFNMTKTAAGVATSTFDIAFGTAGTTADTARVSFTKPAGVANADDCFVEIDAIVRGPLSASGIVSGVFVLHDNQTGAGGHLAAGKYNFVSPALSAAFDVTTPTFVGLCITSGASDAITIQQCQAEAWNL